MSSGQIDIYPIHVEPFQTDFTGHATLGFLGNELLDVAGRHSQRRGWGLNALDGVNRTWVLSRLCIELSAYPLQQEDIRISTWVESVIRLFTYRNFALHGADGTTLGYARSVWSMIDLDTRKPCDLLSLFDGDILHHVVPEEDNVCPIQGYGRFHASNLQHVRTIDTQYSDVDINGHINSIRCINHMLDLFPCDRYRTHQVGRIEIAYKAEAHYGDTLAFYMEEASPLCYLIEVRKNDNEVTCQSTLHFTPRER